MRIRRVRHCAQPRVDVNKKTALDLVDLVCGPEIGRGVYRTVFECRLRHDLVIKHDNRGNHSNVLEYTMWQELADTPIGKWLAPVEWLSDDGIWLVQRKTELIRPSELPSKVPAIFCDLKLDNWGLLDGHPVCHDYGNSMLFSIAKGDGGRLVKANWVGGYGLLRNS